LQCRRVAEHGLGQPERSDELNIGFAEYGGVRLGAREAGGEPDRDDQLFAQFRTDRDVVEGHLRLAGTDGQLRRQPREAIAERREVLGGGTKLDQPTQEHEPLGGLRIGGVVQAETLERAGVVLGATDHPAILTDSSAPGHEVIVEVSTPDTAAPTPRPVTTVVELIRRDGTETRTRHDDCRARPAEPGLSEGRPLGSSRAKRWCRRVRGREDGGYGIARIDEGSTPPAARARFLCRAACTRPSEPQRSGPLAIIWGTGTP
jgi:hypothetical protein